LPRFFDPPYEMLFRFLEVTFSTAFAKSMTSDDFVDVPHPVAEVEAAFDPQRAIRRRLC
jgi:hypothetical protein